MKNVLYVSNIEVPYRSEFFNQLSKKVNLTVLYERKKSSNRDSKWASSIKANYSIKYLKGLDLNNEYSFDFRILNEVFSKKYDVVILGCCNSLSQMLVIFLFKLFNKKYILTLDGEYFLDGYSLKKIIKRFFIKGAEKYLIAGEKSADNLAKYVPKEKIVPFYFSSLTKTENNLNAKKMNYNMNDVVLVVGQYFDYKGLDFALEIAKLDTNIKYKFIGSGKRSNLLDLKIKEENICNVEVVPFLQKDDLQKEFQQCKCLLLTSKQECWGLVINEAASFGCPIISTKGSGAAIEFLSDKSKYLSNDKSTILKLIRGIDNNNTEIKEYKKYLLAKNSNYFIEKNVQIFLDVINKDDIYEN